MWWLECTDVLPDQTAGFHPRRCTMDCILSLVSCVEHERGSGNITVAVFLDVSHAFDTASHVHILEALLKLNIQGKTLSWINNFLTNLQFVRVQLTATVRSTRCIMVYLKAVF